MAIAICLFQSRWGKFSPVSHSFPYKFKIFSHCSCAGSERRLEPWVCAMSTASKSLLTAVSLAEVDEWNGFLVAVSVSVFPLLLRYKRRLRDGNVNHKMFTNSKEKYSTIFMSASDSLLHLYTLRCLKLACKHTHTEHNAVMCPDRDCSVCYQQQQERYTLRPKISRFVKNQTFK